MKSAIIIGSGFGGLGTANILAKAGYNVTVLEKNDKVGGRANIFSDAGYTFDMGPSWYLMPDVFEHFFKLLGEDVNDHLDLVKLGPSYRIFFKDTDREPVDIYSDLERDIPTLEALEPGAGDQLREYLRRAEEQYEIAYDRFMFKNYSSVFDFLNWEVMTEGRKLAVFEKMDKYVKRYFKTPELQKIMQYTLVFLGSSPYNTPALYNIMSHIDFNMGVYYPQGGLYEIVKALKNIAEKNGAEFLVNAPVKKIITEGGKATGVELEDGTIMNADMVISNADIEHTEMQLLEEKDRSYGKKYWDKKVLAPSALIMYLGVDGEIPNLTHHNLIFSKDWEKNFAEIFDDAKWPSDPSLYICNPSKTDPSVAPVGKENLFVLVPIAAGLEYTQEDLERYADKTLETMEKECDIPDLRKRVEVRHLFSVKDFQEKYNSFKGSALGLAHTLGQTAAFRPDTVSKKVDNLYYVGGNTNPGIGMPICLISAELVYKRLTGDKSSGPLEKI